MTGLHLQETVISQYKPYQDVPRPRLLRHDVWICKQFRRLQNLPRACPCMHCHMVPPPFQLHCTKLGTVSPTAPLTPSTLHIKAVTMLTFPSFCGDSVQRFQGRSHPSKQRRRTLCCRASVHLHFSRRPSLYQTTDICRSAGGAIWLLSLGKHNLQKNCQTAKRHKLIEKTCRMSDRSHKPECRPASASHTPLTCACVLSVFFLSEKTFTCLCVFLESGGLGGCPLFSSALPRAKSGVLGPPRDPSEACCLQRGPYSSTSSTDKVALRLSAHLPIALPTHSLHLSSILFWILLAFHHAAAPLQHSSLDLS